MNKQPGNPWASFQADRAAAAPRRRMLLGPATACALAAVLGCEAMPTPKGYVRVDPPWNYTYRAVSADGAVVSVRTVENPRQGTLDFWAKAVSGELLDARGYKLAARQDVKGARGLPGIEMLMKTQVEGIDYAYLLTLFVKSDRVIVFEATGPAATLDADLPAIRNAIASSSLL